jgi:hypothetical protein
MFGVVVCRGAAVRVRALAVVAPRADEQHVTDDEPAGLRAPRRLEDVRAADVALARRNAHLGRREAEHPGVAVEHRTEEARAVIRGTHIHSTFPLGATSAVVSQSDRNA